MSNKTRTLIEAVVFISFSVFMSALTVYGALGIDPTQTTTTTLEAQR